jgi:hypothetical protein
VFLIGVALAALVALVALVAVPHSLDAPAAATLTPLGVAALLLLYAAAGWSLRRRPSPADATSAAIGLLAGALWLGTLRMRSDYRHQFLTSGARTMDVFLVQDILTGASAHLVINLIRGLAGAAIAIGLATGRRVGLRPDRPSPGPPATPPS